MPILTPTADILLIDDSPTDVLLTREALAEARVLCRLHVAENGEKALNFLRRLGPFASAPRPQLILLDLNLPRRNGHEILADIKTDPALLAIPVIILTVSTAEEDIQGAYARHANCYLAKPLDFARFTETMARLQEFWLRLATLPLGAP